MLPVKCITFDMNLFAMKRFAPELHLVVEHVGVACDRVPRYVARTLRTPNHHQLVLHGWRDQALRTRDYIAQKQIQPTKKSDPIEKKNKIRIRL